MFSEASVSHSVNRGLAPPHLETPRWTETRLWTDTAPPFRSDVHWRPL